MKSSSSSQVVSLARHRLVVSRGRFLSSTAAASEELVVSSLKGKVRTLTMNNPAKYNGWTKAMLRALFAKMDEASADDETKVVILTGSGKYYSAGVDLAGSLAPQWPSKLKRTLYEQNKLMFGKFLDFPKPIIAAVQGPAIGASVTTATLCDAVVATERATFNTPFARLGVTPEGCSSVTFPKLLGPANAERMLGPENWTPNGKEAAEVGLVTAYVATDDLLLPKAEELAQKLINSTTKRSHMGNPDTAGLKEVNDRESRQLADAFLSAKFLQAQADFMKSKNKSGPARLFSALVLTRPLWSLFL